MPFREKTAWISLLASLVVWAVYFMKMADSAQTGDYSGRFFGLFIATMGTLVVVQVALSILAAVLDPKDAMRAADERDIQIDLKATRVAFYVLTIGGVVVAACGASIAVGRLSIFSTMIDPMLLLVNGVLLVLVLAELVKAAGTIFYYRRGH